MLPTIYPRRGKGGRYHYVYLTRNRENGFVYVGKHVCDTPFDPTYVGSGSMLLAAVQSTGRDAFDVVPLGWCESCDDAMTFETSIVTREFVARDDTYNVAIGGHGFLSGNNHPLWKRSHSKEHRERIAQAKKGKPLTKEHKENVSRKRKGLLTGHENGRARGMRVYYTDGSVRTYPYQRLFAKIHGKKEGWVGWLVRTPRAWPVNGIDTIVRI